MSCQKISNESNDNGSNEQSNEGNNEKSSTLESEDNKFSTIPSHWGPEHAVLVPIRHCMHTAGEHIDETAWMNYFFEKFGSIGQLSSLVWQRT